LATATTAPARPLASPHAFAIVGACSSGLCLLVFAPLLRRMVTTGDFPAHADFAAQFLATGRPAVPHFAYHLLLMATRAVMPSAGWPGAAVLVTLTALVAAALVLAFWIAAALGPQATLPRLLLASLLPLLLLGVQPLLLPLPYGWDRWLIGYFPANQWHNPTTLLSKPVALGLFGLGWRALRRGPAASAMAVAGCAALVMVSALIKPSFVIAFLPALTIAALLRRDVADWRLLVAGIAVPAVVFLAGQYVFYYAFNQASAGIQFAPLLVLRFYTAVDPVTLTLKLLASILFPLTVTACFPAALRDGRLALAWGTFAIGAVYAYLLAEGGGHADHGNFLWSGQLAAFVLFAVAAVATLGALQQSPRRGVRLRAALCGAVLAAHAVSAVYYLRASWLG
jgi:hypothetical protein